MLIKYLIFFSAISFSQVTLAKIKGHYVPGEILVKYKSTISTSTQKNLIEREGAKSIGKILRNSPVRVKLSRELDMENAIEDFKKDPDVEYAQPNYIYHATAIPNDPSFAQAWGFRNTGQQIVSAGGPDSPTNTHNPGTAGLDMKMEYAWNTITDCSSVIVAVVDTGVNYNQTDLVNNMWNGGGSYPNHGYDFVSNDDDPMDLNGHGTHVAGTIGAHGNNGTGTTGVCWRSTLMAIRVLDTTGAGTTAQLVSGINFAVTNGAKVINLSLGGGPFDNALNAAINNAQANSAIIVIAAGNDNNNNDGSPSYPCSYPQTNIICVAALSQNYSLASFSNYGATSVDVGAPGVNILSAWPGTHTKTLPALNSGWDLSTYTGSRWGYTTASFDGVAENILALPHNYDYGGSNKYSNNSDSQIWRTFNLSSVDAAVLKFYMVVDTQASNDLLGIYAKSGSTTPMSAGTKLDEVSGSSSGAAEEYEYDLDAFRGGNMTFGFKLTSDGSITDNGVAVAEMSLETLVLGNNTYNVISGTSMAAPNVAGLAAMIMAYNPSYFYSDVVTSIKNGGVTTASLAGKTATGKAVSGIGSLNYIATPVGGSAVIVP